MSLSSPLSDGFVITSPGRVAIAARPETYAGVAV
jgi:hypothetical protein